MQKNNDIRILCGRLRMIRSELSMTQEDMARIIGIGKSALSMIETGRASLSERNRNILIQTLNVNPEWLESGTGAMFNEQFPERTFLKGSDRPVGSQSVPLYNVEGTAGLVPLFLDKASRQPVDYIHIPNLPKCDGAIYVVGDSMYPLLKSGDIVLFHNDSQYILDALPAVLKYYAENGYSVVPISEILLTGETTIDIQGRQQPVSTKIPEV